MRVNDSKDGNGHKGDIDVWGTGDRNQCLANEAPAPCQKEALTRRSSEGPCASGGANARPVEAKMEQKMVNRKSADLIR